MRGTVRECSAWGGGIPGRRAVYTAAAPGTVRRLWGTAAALMVFVGERDGRSSNGAAGGVGAGLAQVCAAGAGAAGVCPALDDRAHLLLRERLRGDRGGVGGPAIDGVAVRGSPGQFQPHAAHAGAGPRARF